MYSSDDDSVVRALSCYASPVCVFLRLSFLRSPLNPAARKKHRVPVFLIRDDAFSF